MQGFANVSSNRKPGENGKKTGDTVSPTSPVFWIFTYTTRCLSHLSPLKRMGNITQRTTQSSTMAIHTPITPMPRSVPSA